MLRYNLLLLPSQFRSNGCFMRALVTFGGQKNSKKVANTYFENLKHLQNLGHLLLTAPSMIQGFNTDVKSLQKFHMIYRRDTGVA